MSTALVIGLPGGGKTTYLAAFWHVVTKGDVDTELTLLSLGRGDRAHLNDIADTWRQAIEQERTKLRGSRLVSMNLQTPDRAPLELTFPDYAGELFQQLWETRVCDQDFVELLKDGNVALFIHADKIRKPRWITEDMADAQRAGIEHKDDDSLAVPWEPKLSPWQPVLVDLLQLLRNPPIDSGPRRLAIVLSAWDKAEDEGLSPADYLQAHLPLLSQYLTANADQWTWRIYGLSAQGDDFDDPEPGAAPRKSAEQLRNKKTASERILLVDGEHRSNDLTRPIAWLMYSTPSQ